MTYAVSQRRQMDELKSDQRAAIHTVKQGNELLKLFVEGSWLKTFVENQRKECDMMRITQKGLIQLEREGHEVWKLFTAALLQKLTVNHSESMDTTDTDS
jgi:hypothetical protein